MILQAENVLEETEKLYGLECPRCNCKHVPVIRTTDSFHCRRRRRECRHCGYRFTTTERLQFQAELPRENYGR